MNCSLTGSLIPPTLPRCTRGRSLTLATDYGRNPIRYAAIPALAREVGLQFATWHRLESPARLITHRLGAVLYVNPLFPEGKRWLTALELIGLWLGIPSRDAPHFAVTAALGALANAGSLEDGAVYRTDATGKCIYANEAACALIGYSPHELSWLEAIEPAARPETIARWQETVRRGISARRNHTFVHSNGRHVPVCSLALPVKMGDHLIGYEGQLSAR